MFKMLRNFRRTISQTNSLLSRLASTEVTADKLAAKKYQNSRQKVSAKVVESVRVEGEIIYGINPVMMALQSGKRKFHKIYFNEFSKRTSDVVDSGKRHGVRCIKSDRQVLSQLARHSDKQVGVHQGVCADVEMLLPEVFKIEDLNETRSGKIFLLLCGVSDPFNLGAILRSAYFLGVDRVLVSSFVTHSAPLSPVVSKASSGVLEIFTPELVRDPEGLLHQLRTNPNWSVMACGIPGQQFDASRVVIDGNVSIVNTMHDVDDSVVGRNVEHDDDDVTGGIVENCNSKLAKNILLLVGNEGSGLPDEILRFCDQKICLRPNRELHPLVDSLNVSVATALIVQYLKNKFAI